MKATRYLFTFLVLAMLALTACHNDDLPGGNTLPCLLYTSDAADD